MGRGDEAKKASQSENTPLSFEASSGFRETVRARAACRYILHLGVSLTCLFELGLQLGRIGVGLLTHLVELVSDAKGRLGVGGHGDL